MGQRTYFVFLLVFLFSICLGLVAGSAAQTVSEDANSYYINDAEPHSGKRVLWPLDGLDVALLVICVFCLSLAGGAGIGGGAILVPVFILVRGWPTPTAVALSNVTILGGSFANFICNVNRHRPNGARTIDWELILMMEPTTIAGALFGAMLNKILPNYITTYLLALMLSFMTLRLFQKGRETYEKETLLLQAAKTAAKATHHAAKALARHLSGSSFSGPSSTAALKIPSRSLQQHKGPDQSSLVYTPPAARHDSQAPDAATAAAAAAYLSRSASNRSRSFIARGLNRLQGPLLVAGDDTGGAAAAGAAAAGSFTAGSFTAGSFVTAGQRGSSAAAAEEAAWLPSLLKQDSRRQLLGVVGSSALFQGDVAPALEPMVALPTDYSSSDSDDSTHPADEAAAAAAARGVTSTGNDAEQDVESGRVYNEHDELRQPLLAESPEGSSDTQQRYDHNGSAAAGAGAGAAGAAKPQSQATGTAAPLAPKDVGWEPCLPLPHFSTLLLLSAWVVTSDIWQASYICGSWQYWLVTLSVLVPVAAILLVFRQILLKKYRHDDLAHDAVLPEGQLHWNSKTTLLYPLYCSTAGLIAGLFGIGGGVVKGPLMLELGVPADVAAATSATMIMFTAGSACVVYSRFGQILPDYAILFIILGFFVTLLSQLLTFFLVKLLGRRSIIVFMMVVLMGIACSIMYLQSVFETERLIAHPEELHHWGHLCPSGSNHGLKALFQQLLAVAVRA